MDDKELKDNLKEEAKESNMETEKMMEEESSSVEDKDEMADRIRKLEKELEEKTKKCEEYFNMLQRTAAEYDNYKKRTLKEKDNLYCNTTVEVAAIFLPVLDNLERALEVAKKDEDNPLKEGVEMIHRQMMDVLKSLEIEQIKDLGEPFNPEFHNAVMHVEDDKYGENEIIEVFQKGYILKDRVLRYSVVKVAN